MKPEPQGVFKQFRKDILLTLLFGLLSSLLGLVMLNTPGFEASHSDLREIPLLIAVFHLSNPLYIIPLCVLTLLDISPEINRIPVFIMHVIPLFVVWYIYRWIDSKQWSNFRLALNWAFVCVIYYLLLLFPILIFTYYWVGITKKLDFFAAYGSLFISGMFELITTTLVTALYLVQLKIRHLLEINNKNLEIVVLQRTQELSLANHELLAMNENLEGLVEERTLKIEAQLQQIVKYANMNSHQVRGPLARILGLMNVMKTETDPIKKEEMLAWLDQAAIELDTIVRKMNRLLEKEMDN